MSAEPDIPAHLTAALEAVLFAAERPISVEELCEVIGRVDEAVLSPDVVHGALMRIGAHLEERASGIQLSEVGGGWELRTRFEQADYVHSMYRKRPVRLSRAALEVLSIVAYRQPCTRTQIDEIRGVDSSSTLRQLLERELVRILGKADDVGRPLIYGTTPNFLAFFGLNSLAELPTLREYTELSQEHMVKLQELDETLRANEQARAEQAAAAEAADSDMSLDAPASGAETADDAGAAQDTVDAGAATDADVGREAAQTADELQETDTTPDDDELAGVAIDPIEDP